MSNNDMPNNNNNYNKNNVLRGFKNNKNNYKDNLFYGKKRQL